MSLALHAVLPVDLTSPRQARLLLTEWLTGHGCHGDAVEDLVYALNEAVTNSVEHAYTGTAGGVITLDATVAPIDDDLVQVVISVSDTGRWRPPPAQTGTRGRGLFMMRALVADLRIDTIATGTRVELHSHPCWCDVNTDGDLRGADRAGSGRDAIGERPPP